MVDEFKGYVSIGDKVWAIIGLIVIVFFVLTSCDKAEEKAKAPQYTEAERKHLMEITNTFVVENKNTGFIKKVDKLCQDSECVYVFWIDESDWNRTSYDDKQATHKAFSLYAKVRGANGGGVRGYYTGKFLN